MKISKGDFPVKLETVGLDEIPVDSITFVLTEDKKTSNEAKQAPPPKPKNTIALF